MAAKSHVRTLKDQDIRRLSAEGLSQRTIAQRLGISRPMVRRVLESSGPTPAIRPKNVPDDFDEIQAEFNELIEAAKASNDLDDYRRVHEVAKTCYANGYRLRYNTLPYLIRLHHLQNATGTNEAWMEYHLEIRGVYADMRAWREAA